MHNFTISKNGINLIKSFEGCYLTSYKCPAGVWTIGWGTTEPINGKKIGPGMKITQAEADNLLLKNLRQYESAVNTYVTYKNLNQNQYDALVSFAYNCGCGALKTSTLLKLLNAGKINEAANEFDKWVRGGGKVLPGLIRRRAAEKALFLKEIKKEIVQDKELADAVSKIIKSGIAIDFNSWKRMDLINLKNVPGLLYKLGGLDYLISKKIITNKTIWENNTYTVNNVRSLLIKYANQCK